ncbi:GAF domain-containing protein [candidate division WOR-3 bacterium]|nr:GAF domain-containing protein [candidate division WOR-3 bacterium]
MQVFKNAAEEIQKIIASSIETNEKLDKVCALLCENFNHYDWTGFYLATPDGSLKLGPFRGEPTEHKVIPRGKGVCGRALENKETVVVENVKFEENYLSCSPMVKSEIVVPVYKKGKIVAEIDIDSHKENAFKQEDKTFLEEVAQKISVLF